MKRLTNKYEDYELQENYPDEKNFGNVCVDDLLEYRRYEEKLRQLEDIEEEFGIDLITLFNLNKSDKIYVKIFDKIQIWDRFKIDLHKKQVWYGYTHGRGYTLRQDLSNYGKGFAITREELENER